jgi:hypothetical protein
MPIEIAHQLRQARLGQLLVEVLPGAALRIGPADGPSVVVARMGDPRGDVLPCQHRAGLHRALEAGLVQPYAGALGLRAGDDLSAELLAPAGADLGSGVYALDDDGPDRHLGAVTTLCPEHAAAAVRTARTVTLPVRLAGGDAGGGPHRMTSLRREVRHDPMLGVTLLHWSHRGHPALSTHVDDVARAESAACVVEELLQSLR